MKDENFYFFLLENPEPSSSYYDRMGNELQRSPRAKQLGHISIGVWKKKILRELLVEADRRAKSIQYVLEGGK